MELASKCSARRRPLLRLEVLRWWPATPPTAAPQQQRVAGARSCHGAAAAAAAAAFSRCSRRAAPPEPLPLLLARSATSPNAVGEAVARLLGSLPLVAFRLWRTTPTQCFRRTLATALALETRNAKSAVPKLAARSAARKAHALFQSSVATCCFAPAPPHEPAAARARLPPPRRSLGGERVLDLHVVRLLAHEVPAAKVGRR